MRCNVPKLASALLLLAGLSCAIAARPSLGDQAAAAAAAAAVPLPSIPGRTFNVTDYGAVGDGKASNTDAFRRAIDACAAAGGGRVVVPAGTYLSGPIRLASNVDLHADAGATVLFSRNVDDYPLTLSNFEGRDTVQCTSPISGEGLHDVAISGAGAFDAQGDVWRPVKRSKMAAAQWADLVKTGGVVDEAGQTWWPSAAAMRGQPSLLKLRASDVPPRVEDYAGYRELLRPPLLLLANCRRVLIEGATFRNSPGWNLHPLLCDDLTIRGVTIYNPEYAQNGDGMDLDSCRNVLVSGCDVNAGDDGICLKSGRDAEGRKRGRPTENVTIVDCTVGHAHGGVVIGSEMSGGVRHVTVNHCVFRGTETGLRFKTTRGRGGVVEDVRVSDVSMTDIRGPAITFDMYYQVKQPQPEPLSERTPSFRNFEIRDVTCRGAAQAIVLRGLPELPIHDITLEAVHITAAGGGQIVDAKDITFRDVRIDAPTPVEVRNVKDFTTDRVTGVAEAR